MWFYTFFLKLSVFLSQPEFVAASIVTILLFYKRLSYYREGSR